MTISKCGDSTDIKVTLFQNISRWLKTRRLNTTRWLNTRQGGLIQDKMTKKIAKYKAIWLKRWIYTRQVAKARWLNTRQDD